MFFDFVICPPPEEGASTNKEEVLGICCFMLWGTHFYNLGVIHNPLLRDVFDTVSREDFLPEVQKSFVDEDRPLEIGFGQTNSQPYTVAFMLNLLDPKPGQKILDIGSGSGWTSTLLAWVVSHKTHPVTALRRHPSQEGNYTPCPNGHPSPTSADASAGKQVGNLKVPSNGGGDPKGGVGKVYAVERIPELVAFGKNNSAKYDFISSGVLKFLQSDGTVGLPQYAPYDRILVSAAFVEFPSQLLTQLTRGGILVVPVGLIIGDVVKAEKMENGKIQKEVYQGFSFVPMVSS